jgi:tetratricopeptide (TPR) repeat protein
MTIIIPIDNFLNTLFFNSNNDKNELFNKLKEFYKIDSIEPTITDEGGYFKIELDFNKVQLEEKKYNNLLNLCESQQFNKALILVKKLIIEYPNISEYHRLLGQILSELDEQEEAINALIDSLRWNPKNEWALLMMGNILYKFKNDIDSALIYYNQILEQTPKNSITLNNIGAVLMQTGKNDEAFNYFNKALEIDPNFPNTYLALGLLKEKGKDYLEAFNFSIKSISYCNKVDEIFNNSMRLAIDSSKAYSEEFDSNEIINKFIAELSYKSEKEIKISADESILTAAKIEFAENYKKDFHLVKYKPSYDSVSHLVLHELMHLELVLEARNIEENQLFTTNNSNKTKFHFSLEKFKKGLEKKGIVNSSVTSFVDSLFNGINNQVYNTPIDLFIEDRIFNRFSNIRPIQFLSLLRFTKEGITATTRKDIVENTPKNILSISKIYNLVNALHLRTLFSVDLLNEFKASKSELNLANKFYSEFLEYRDDKKEGEEYELVQHWGEDLGFDAYFNLIPELEHKNKTIDEVIDSINNDPLGLEESNPSNDRKMKQFLNEHSDDDINKAVVMYMVDSLNYFKNYSTDEIKKIAFEIATLGMTGIDPNKKGYSIPSIKNSSFSGYKTLAYYYTSWALALPEMLKEIQLPFNKEYALAQTLNNL